MNLELGLSKKEAFFCRTGFRSLLAIVAYEPRRRQENDQIFCPMFMLKLIILPQQAWGRQRKALKKEMHFLAGTKPAKWAAPRYLQSRCTRIYARR
jgi:hypothetical protein